MRAIQRSGRAPAAAGAAGQGGMRPTRCRRWIAYLLARLLARIAHGRFRLRLRLWAHRRARRLTEWSARK
jgi:hypothetical protein